MRLSLATAAMLLAMAALLSACGGGGTAAVGGSGRAASTRAGSEPAGTGPTGGDCRRQLRGLLEAMASLRGDLARGLDYGDYLSELGHARREYAQIHPARLQGGCVFAVGGPTERALNLYIGAADAWGDCLATAGCGSGEVEPVLQRRWAAAASWLSRAQRGVGPARS